MAEHMFKGSGPLAVAERDAELERISREAEAVNARHREAIAKAQERELAQVPFHTVTVTTLLRDAGTPDEYREVESVTFKCTAPPEAQCRTYPDDCGCEQWGFDEVGTLDDNGHVRTSGNVCWLASWFDVDMGIYVGDDYDDMRDDCVPAIDRTGNILISYGDEWPEWEFVPEPADSGKES